MASDPTDPTDPTDLDGTTGLGPVDDGLPGVAVLGHLRVDPADRDAYLTGCRDIVVAARAAPGCVDFHLSADPLEDDRINVVERWTSAAAVDAFRGSGPDGDQAATIRSAVVDQIELGRVHRL